MGSEDIVRCPHELGQMKQQNSCSVLALNEYLKEEEDLKKVFVVLLSKTSGDDSLTENEKDDLRTKMNECYTGLLLLNQSKVGRHYVDVHLETSTKVLLLFLDILQDDTYTTDYSASKSNFRLQEVFALLEEYVLPRLADIRSPETKVSIAEIHKILTWIDNTFLARVQNTCPFIVTSQTWDTERRFLIQLLLGKTVRSQFGEALEEGFGLQSAVERTVGIFRVFFTHWKPYFATDPSSFGSVLQGCFDLTLQQYLESFFANTLARGVKDSFQTAEAIRSDFLRLVIFFNGKICENYHGVGGFYTQLVINQRLHLLSSMAVLVDASVPREHTLDDIRVILGQFEPAEAAYSVVLHLARMRKKRIESARWLQAIAQVEREVRDSEEKNSNGVATYKYSSPTLLRNSWSVQKPR